LFERELRLEDVMHFRNAALSLLAPAILFWFSESEALRLGVGVSTGATGASEIMRELRRRRTKALRYLAAALVLAHFSSAHAEMGTPPNADQILAEARAAFRTAKTANAVEAIEIICRTNLSLLSRRETDQLVTNALSLLRNDKIEEADDAFKRAREFVEQRNAREREECKPPFAAVVTSPESATPPRIAAAEQEKATEAPPNHPGAGSSPPTVNDSSHVRRFVIVERPPSEAPPEPRTAVAELDKATEAPPNHPGAASSLPTADDSSHVQRFVIVERSTSEAPPTPGTAAAESAKATKLTLTGSELDSGAAPQFAQKVIVRPGAATQFDHVFSLKDDCSKDDDPKIAISTEPKHGNFSAKAGQDVPKFSSGSDFVSCNGKLAPSTQFYYQPDASYSGDDQLVLKLTFPDGYVENETYDFHAAVAIRSNDAAADDTEKNHTSKTQKGGSPGRRIVSASAPNEMTKHGLWTSNHIIPRPGRAIGKRFSSSPKAANSIDSELQQRQAIIHRRCRSILANQDEYDNDVITLCVSSASTR
jgi:hypothetical protein